MTPDHPPPRVANRTDLAALTAIMTTAFSDDPVWGRYSFPDTYDREERAARFWSCYLDATLRFPWTFVSARLEAAAVWTPPGEPELTAGQERELIQLLRELLGRRQSRIVVDIFERLDAAHPDHEPHHYLGLLGTHADHRGAGHGMALLAACLERIDAEGSPAYLESTNPANDHRYMRHGFEPYGTVELANGHRVTTMWREAQPPP